MTQEKKLIELVIKGSLIIFVANIACFILGYLRDALVIKNFGASYLTDAWYIASNVPELLFKFLLFGALGATFIPVFIEYLTKKKEREAWEIASSVINTSAILLGVGAIVGVIFASSLVTVFAPGFDQQAHVLATKLTQIVLPLMVFVGVGGLFSAVYRANFNYFLPSLTPVINVAVIIFFIIIFSQKLGIFSVAWGTVLGCLISFLILFLFLFIYKKPYRFKINLKHPAIKNILILMIPLIGAEIIGKGIGLVDRIFASFLGKGSITVFVLANRIMIFPVIFFSTTVAVAIFPVLSRYAANDKKKDFSRVFIFSIKVSLLVIVPCIAGIIILGKPIIEALFQHGEFGSADTEITWQVLLFLSPALVAISLKPILARTCYALKKNWMLFRFELFGFVLNILFNYILIKYLGISGIALATTIVVSITVLYLLHKLGREVVKINIEEIKLILYKIFLATLSMGIWCYLTFDFLSGYLSGNYKALVLNLLLTIFSSGIIYFIILKILKLEELRLLWSMIKETIARR